MSTEKANTVDHEVIPDPTHAEVMVWVSETTGEYGTSTPMASVVYGNTDPATTDPRRFKGGENTRAVLVKIRVPLSDLRYSR